MGIDRIRARSMVEVETYQIMSDMGLIEAKYLTWREYALRRGFQIPWKTWVPIVARKYYYLICKCPKVQ